MCSKCEEMARALKSYVVYQIDESGVVAAADEIHATQLQQADKEQVREVVASAIHTGVELAADSLAATMRHLHATIMTSRLEALKFSAAYGTPMVGLPAIDGVLNSTQEWVERFAKEMVDKETSQAAKMHISTGILDGTQPIDTVTKEQFACTGELLAKKTPSTFAVYELMCLAGVPSKFGTTHESPIEDKYAEFAYGIVSTTLKRVEMAKAKAKAVLAGSIPAIEEAIRGI